MAGKATRIDRSGGNDDLEIGSTRQELSQITQQKINVQTAFMRFVDNDGVITLEQWIALGLGQ